MNQLLLTVFSQDPSYYTDGYNYLIQNHLNHVSIRNFVMVAICIGVVVCLVVSSIVRAHGVNDARRNADALNVLKSNEVALKEKEVTAKVASQDLDAFMAFQKNPELYASFIEFKACNGDPEKLAALAAKTSGHPVEVQRTSTVSEESSETLFNEEAAFEDLMAQAAELDSKNVNASHTDFVDDSARFQQELFDQQQINNMHDNNDLML